MKKILFFCIGYVNLYAERIKVEYYTDDSEDAEETPNGLFATYGDDEDSYTLSSDSTISGKFVNNGGIVTPFFQVKCYAVF